MLSQTSEKGLFKGQNCVKAIVKIGLFSRSMFVFLSQAVIIFQLSSSSSLGATAL
jgi:hypothetical protein